VKGNRIVVDDFNGVKGLKDIFAIGDVASIESGSHPMLAPVAMQQGRNLARNLNRKNENEWKKFKYFDKGTMATIGRSRAVADLKVHSRERIFSMDCLAVYSPHVTRGIPESGHRFCELDVELF
jgi:NADH dehydrogenase